MNTRSLLLLLILSALPIRAEEATTFTSEPFSLSISAPRTWKLVPEDFPTEEYAVRKDLLAVVTKHEKVPIVRIVKPVAGNRTISPAVQIFVVPDRGSSPKVYLWSVSRGAAEAFEDFHITHDPSDTTLNGIKAATIESTFITPYPGGRRFPTLSRVWAIPHNKMMFVVSVTGQPDDLKALTDDIDIILKSIKFKNE
jgi:hypothetical protein